VCGFGFSALKLLSRCALVRCKGPQHSRCGDRSICVYSSMLICGWRGSSGRGARCGRGSWQQTGQLRAVLEGARAVPRRRATGISSPKAKTTGEWWRDAEESGDARSSGGSCAADRRRTAEGGRGLRRRRCARRRATTPRTSRRRRKGSWTSSSMHQRDMSFCGPSQVEPAGACWPRASAAPDPIREALQLENQGRRRGDTRPVPPPSDTQHGCPHPLMCMRLADVPPLLLLSLIAAAPRRNGASASPRVASVASPSSRPPSCLPRAECSRECQ